ncbi:MAG: C4-type zinc ribbon domain-containing protein, partial [Polyangiales bacterium]
KELLRTEEQSSEGKLAELRTERDVLLAGRDELVALVDPAVIRRYDRLRKGIQNVVAIISDGTCTACRMALPPQLYIDLQRGTEIQDCPHCRRIVLFAGNVAEVVGETETDDNSAA